MSSAIPFTIWVFDCPECGGRNEIGDGEPFFTETCWDCGQPIRMGSPDWDEGHEAGHEDARAVQSTYPEPTPNPYRAEGDHR